MRAKLLDLSPTFTGEQKLTLVTKEDCRPMMDDLCESEVDVTIRKYRENRNLSQNGLYWSSLTQLARHLGVSNPRMHNMMLRQYGQPEMYDGELVFTMLPDTDEAEKKALEADTYHIKPTSHVKQGSNGVQYRAYMLMRGSSTYNTEEFSRLLDGLLEACNDCGIHVMSGRTE